MIKVTSKDKKGGWILFNYFILFLFSRYATFKNVVLSGDVLAIDIFDLSASFMMEGLVSTYTFIKKEEKVKEKSSNKTC